MVNLGKITGPFLLLIPLILTVTIGVYFNNFNNNGFATPSVAAFNGCPTLILWNSQYKDNPEICQAYNSTYTGPCQSANNATFCGFQKPSVLNPNSLYTCILTVSWQCFINGITGANSAPAPQPFAFFNIPSAPIFNDCLNVNGSTYGQPTILFSCDQINANGFKVPANQSSEFQSGYICALMNSITPGSGGNYVYYGCNNHSNHAPINNTWSAIEAFNETYFAGGGPLATNCYSPPKPCELTGSALIYTNSFVNGSFTNSTDNWFDCGSTISTTNVNVSATPECKAGYEAGAQVNTGSGSSIFFFSQILAAIGGIVLILIGFGMGFSGGALTFNFSVTPNSQGTRYAQILGFALLFIVPFDIEFSGPFTLLAIFGIGTTILALFAIFEVMGIFFMVAEPVGAG